MHFLNKLRIEAHAYDLNPLAQRCVHPSVFVVSLFLLICQPVVVYEVLLMVETIRPVKGELAVFSYSPQLI